MFFKWVSLGSTQERRSGPMEETCQKELKEGFEPGFSAAHSVFRFGSRYIS